MVEAVATVAKYAARLYATNEDPSRRNLVAVV